MIGSRVLVVVHVYYAVLKKKQQEMQEKLMKVKRFRKLRLSNRD